MAGLSLLTACGDDEPNKGQPIQVKPESERTILVMDTRGNLYNTDGEVVLSANQTLVSPSQIIPFAQDYYMAGTSQPSAGIGYWKNGSWTRVADAPQGYLGTAGISKLFDDIYLLVNCESGVRVYKNGTPIQLTTSRGDGGLHITASGSHVYVCGSSSGTGSAEALMWTDGERHVLPTSRGTQRAVGYCVYANGTHTLVGGNMDNTPVVWIDKALYKLPLADGFTAGVVYDVAEQGGKVYSVGHRVSQGGLKQATVWIEGQARSYATSNSGTVWSDALGLQFYSQDFYVLTVDYDDTDGDGANRKITSHVWLNGQRKCSLPGVSAAGFVVI